MENEAHVTLAIYVIKARATSQSNMKNMHGQISR